MTRKYANFQFPQAIGPICKISRRKLNKAPIFEQKQQLTDKEAFDQVNNSSVENTTILVRGKTLFTPVILWGGKFDIFLSRQIGENRSKGISQLRVEIE